MNALSTLYSALGKQLLKYAFSFTGELHTAEDIVSEAFLRGTEHCIANNDLPSRAWFYKVTRNIALDWLRKKGRYDHHEIPDTPDFSYSANPEAMLELSEEARHMNHLLSTLPENYKSVLVLREYNELTYLEIAGVMGITVDHVKVLLYRAKQKMRNLLRRDES